MDACLRGRIFLFGMAAIGVVLQATLNLSISKLPMPELPPPEKATQAWRSELFRISSFGNVMSAVDWIWMRAVLDPDMKRLPRGEHPRIYYDFDLLTELDPAFFEGYYAGGGLLAIIRDDDIGARDLLTKGLDYRRRSFQEYPKSFWESHWAGSWYLALQLGYVHLFELNDMKSAAAAFKEAAAFPGAPPFLQRLGARFDTPGGEYEVGLRVLNFLIAGEKDPRARKKLERDRESLHVSQYVFDLNRSFRQYLSDQKPGRTTIPPKELHRSWQAFLRASGNSARDPWGGLVSLSERGEVVTSTPHDKVFGLR